ncbi:MAG TPA: S8 family serine peptidase [archaeon]|nr:S8 family serine peptidase [archaeon]
MSRNSKFQYPVFLLAFFISFVPASLPAQIIEPSLELILREAPPDSAITVLVRPAYEVEISSLEGDLLRRKATRAERHRRVIAELRQKSEAAQAGLRSHLAAARRSRRISDYRQFWIANLVAVTAVPEVIREIAARSDVAAVLENKSLVLQASQKKKESPANAAAPPDGTAYLASTAKYFNWALNTIKVRTLWERGLTGRGILVGSIDSGVDGNQPALAGKWRGANGATATESWYDPWNENSFFPVDDDYIQGPTHGTMAMGCLVGQQGADTIGVAPDAQWIAANGFENRAGSMTTTSTLILGCFEWMADPDRDPETIDDVPDVLNLSWADPGSRGCPDTYWEPIRNLNTLGVAVIIAAGNKDPNAQGADSKVGSPANNPAFFAVGSVDSASVHSTFSTIGPSLCDNKTIKPDVVAPGEGYLSTAGSAAGGGYHSVRGTSFATPLVAGIAALLKQYNPELLPDEITGAIRSSCTELGPVGPDNEYGWGLVNAQAALAKIGPASLPRFSIVGIQLQAGPDGLIAPGEEVSVVLRITNMGTNAVSVAGKLSSSSADVSVVSAAAYFGQMPSGNVVSNSNAPFVLSFAPDIQPQELRTFTVTLTSGSYTQAVSFRLNVGGEPEPVVEGVGTHTRGKAGLSITNYGVIGKDSEDGGGFVYPLGSPTSRDQLFQGALLLATGPLTVSDASYSKEPMSSNTLDFDHDFTTIQNGNIKVLEPGSLADQEITGAFADSRAASPLEVTIYQRSYAYSAETDNDYIIIEYRLAGPADKDLGNLFAGQHLDWDVGGTSNDDMVSYNSGLALAYMYDSGGDMFVGHTLLTQRVSGFKALNFQNEIKDGFTGEEKYNAMSLGVRDTLPGAQADWSELLAGGPLILKPGKEVVVAFAVVAGATLKELRENTANARARFLEIAQAREIDITPPQIAAEACPDVGPGVEAYTIQAALTDDSEIAEVDLYWWIEGFSSFWRKVIMEPAAEGNIFQAQLPGQKLGTLIKYYIQAFDTQGNQAFAPQGAPSGEYYSFKVIDLDAPVISGTEALPDTGGSSGGFLISTRVDDSALAGVYAVLIFRAEGQADTLELFYKKADSTYTGIVQGLGRGTKVDYYIVAQDSAGNLATDPADAPQNLLSFDFLPLVRGDGDLNGVVNIFDLIEMLRVLGGSSSPSWEKAYVMDLNRNGRVDIFDLIELLRLLSQRLALTGDRVAAP